MTRAVLLLLLLLFAACGSPSIDPLPPERVVRHQSCAADMDCEIVRNGCCCEVVAVARDQKATFLNIFECEKSTLSCSCAPRNEIAVCQNGLCELVPRR